MTGHPNKRVYYNSLVGGIRGAEGMHQMDHLCISMREAIEYMNAVRGSQPLGRGRTMSPISARMRTYPWFRSGARFGRRLPIGM